MFFDENEKKPAVFLDRDGVLTEEKSYIRSVEDLHIFSYTKECVAKIKEKGYYAIAVTNQSGVARGYFTENALIEMNDYLKQSTGLDAVYYCPHHQDGIVPKYARKCNCRKPETGLIEKAIEDFNIDMKKSFIVGDRAGDIETGKRAGITTVLLESGYGIDRMEWQVFPDYLLYDLRQFIAII